MSLARTTGYPRAAGFPRVSGDEPLYGDDVVVQWPFSPRERG